MILGKQINVSFLILLSMPTLDIAMPLALLLVVTVAFLLNKRAEKKLKASMDEPEFKTKDKLLFGLVLGVVISTMTLTSFINPGNMFENVLLSVFLGSYTMLLFTLTYIFSDLKKRKAQLFSIGIGIISLIMGIVSFLDPLPDAVTPFRVGAFFALTILCFAIAAYEEKKSENKKAKWYIAAQPPALFLLIFLFFNILATKFTHAIWSPGFMEVFGVTILSPCLLNIFGATFAILIILYLSPLFNWKTVVIFAFLLTLLDIILVFTGPMVAAADTFTGLGLPVIIYLPSIPAYFTEAGVMAIRGLGLGDFFFAGILAIQTFNKFGKKYGHAAIAAMILSFTIWQIFLLDLLTFFDLRGFPATVFIITGWIPIAIIATLLHRKQPKESPPPPLQTEPLAVSP
ncbi:MAG: hypothetical protein FWD52_01130 [Candidatus Bathyarchaeota archaeon]|nr:hypothetical protein [Candidatus Termiticorpusculum sp.]